MNQLHKYDGIDLFRMVAAFLAVTAHTYPLSSISSDMNYMLVHVFARIAVPFFMMATGYFLLPRYFDQSENDDPDNRCSLSYQNRESREPLFRFIKKIGLLYAGATLLYLPVSIYAGFYSDGNVFQVFIRNLLVDGSFYHLWYLPAVMFGVLLVYVLSHKCSLHLTFSISVVLYLLGLLGDSYFHLIANIPLLQTTYEAAFQVFSYTRNGLFYAPVFLTMGVMIAKQEQPMSTRTNAIGFIVFMLLMLVEGILLQQYGNPRHTSMYLMLLPCSYFLFGLLKGKQGKRSPFMRDTSMWIYILHPLIIVAVRGMARLIGHTDLLVGNSVIFFSCVSVLAYACAVATSMRMSIISRLLIVHHYIFKHKEMYRQQNN